MAVRKWIGMPGGRVKRWKKSRAEERPGGSTTRFTNRVPPHFYRNMLNRRERRRAKAAITRGNAERHPHVHPRVAAWYW